MVLKRFFIIVLSIYLLFFIIIFVLFFMPIKYAVKDIKYILKNDKYKEIYIIESCDASSGHYVANNYENNIKDDLYFEVFSGKNFEEDLGLILGLRSEIKNNNKFIIYGESYEYIPEAESYGFHIEKWEILYPIEREPSLYSIIASKDYITLFDYIQQFKMKTYQ